MSVVFQVVNRQQAGCKFWLSLPLIAGLVWRVGNQITTHVNYGQPGIH
ncbi:hypothetical protein [Microcoleus sp. FACHB-1515]